MRPKILLITLFLTGLGNIIFAEYSHKESINFKNDISVDIQATYLPNHSNISNDLYAYTYTVNITNNGDLGVQLRTRHWFIKDETEKTKEVFGIGVVGRLPYIAPGETFQYTSGAAIHTPTGLVKGTYEMIDTNGEIFKVEIPEFILSNL